MEKFAFHVPIAIGRGDKAVTATIVKDYAGDPGEYSDHKTKYDATEIIPGCFTYVEPAELVSARIGAPKSYSYGAAQLLICNDFIDFESKQSDTYIWELGHYTLYIVLAPGSDDLDVRLRCHWGYGKQLPNILLGADLSQAIKIDVQFENLDPPAVPLLNEEEIDEIRKGKEKGTAVTFGGAIIAGFLAMIVVGFVGQQMDVAENKRAEDLKVKITQAEMMKAELLQRHMKAPSNLRGAINRLAQIYMIDPKFETSSSAGVNAPQSLLTTHIRVKSSGKMEKDPTRIFGWVDRSELNTDGSFSFSVPLSGGDQ